MASISRREWMALGAASVATAASGVSYAILAPATSAAQLHATENPYGPCEGARRAMTAEVARANRYVDLATGTGDLAALIAEREGVAPDCVLVGHGSTEVLHMAALAIGTGDGETLTADPTFPVLARQVENASGTRRTRTTSRRWPGP
jgi:histidinol-phosphate aminotransferase